MTVAIDPKRAKIPLKPFLRDYQSGLGDREIMQKYGLSASHFVSLIKALLQKQVLKPVDLAKRKEIMAQQEQVKETQFLKSLYICPNCGHPHPEQFEVCPACGFKPAEAAAPSEEGFTGVTTTGGHFYVEDEDELEGDDEEREYLKTEPLEPPDPEPTADETPDTTEPIEGPVSKPEPTEPTDRRTAPLPPQPAPPKNEPREKPSPSKDESTEKPSPFKSVRSLISRIRKP